MYVFIRKKSCQPQDELWTRPLSEPHTAVLRVTCWRMQQSWVRNGVSALAVAVSLRWLRVDDLWLSRPLSRRKLRRKLRVAIVGAGFGGASLARWLRDMYGDDLELTIVSDGPVGGRCQTISCMPENRSYEAGAG